LLERKRGAARRRCAPSAKNVRDDRGAQSSATVRICARPMIGMTAWNIGEDDHDTTLKTTDNTSVSSERSNVPDDHVGRGKSECSARVPFSRRDQQVTVGN
jgi:hypothetical protein